MLYYDIDHKVGAVGVLCPQAGKGVFFALANEAQLRSDKTNIRCMEKLAMQVMFSCGTGKPVPYGKCNKPVQYGL